MSFDLKQKIIEVSKELGFSDVSFTSAEALIKSEEHFLKWREQGYAADMQYLLKDNPINARPMELFEEAKTLIMFTAHYYSPCPTRPSLEHGRIAAYAVGLDYHKVLKKKIHELINHPELKDIFAKSKFFTDAVPLLEKSFAKKAGLGFRGKNSLLISKEKGSFNFILEIITDLEFETDEQLPSLRGVDGALAKETTWQSSPSATGSRRFTRDDNGTCGGCVRCMDICPTNALPEPYVLDARKCISYHTIENRGDIPEELSKNFGEWFFGCDLCQTICPYNRKLYDTGANKANPPVAGSRRFARDDSGGLPVFPEFNPEAGFGHWFYLPEILDLEENKHQSFFSLLTNLENHKFIRNDDFKIIKRKFEKQLNSKPEIEDLDFIFQTKFAQTPLLRPKRQGLIRNAKIVLNNSNQ